MYIWCISPFTPCPTHWLVWITSLWSQLLSGLCGPPWNPDSQQHVIAYFLRYACLHSLGGDVCVFFWCAIVRSYSWVLRDCKGREWETTSCDFGPMRVCWKNLHTAIGCSILDIVCTSKWENVSLNYFEIDSLALQKGRSTNQHPYTKPSKCEQWREERCGQTLQGMWMSMKPRTMLQDQMWMNMEQAKINDYAARSQKWNTQHTAPCTFSFMTTTHTLAHVIEDKAVFAYC